MKIKTILILSFLFLPYICMAQEVTLESFDEKNIAVFNELVRKITKTADLLDNKVATIDTAVTALQAAEDTIVSDVNSFTRDTSTASGTQAVTGVGFAPKAIIFLSAQDSSKEISIGFDDGVQPASLIQTNTAGTFTYSTTYSIYAFEAAGTEYAGKISSFDSDGFTVSWTKTGSPTGTIAVLYLVIR